MTPERAESILSPGERRGLGLVTPFPNSYLSSDDSHPAQPRRDSTTHDGGMSLQVGSRVRVTPNCRAARLAGRTGAVVSLGRQVERKLSN